MGKFSNKSTSRELLFQWVNNCLDDPNYIPIEEILENITLSTSLKDYDEELLRSLVDTYKKEHLNILSMINNTEHNLQKLTLSILACAITEFIYLNQDIKQKPLIISEYLKITDLFNKDNDRITHFLLDKQLLLETTYS